MTSFVIGKVIEPETRDITVQGKRRSVCSFGILSGRTCSQFDVFDDAKVFSKAQFLEDGELVVAVIGSGVDKNGKLRTYLNGLGACPEGLREQLLSLVKADN